MKILYSKQIEQLYLQMFNMLFEYARSTLSNDALAEEAVQETFRIACQKPEALCASPNPEGWLVNTLKYVLRNMERSRNIANRILCGYFAANITELTATNDRVGVELLYDDIADTEEFKLLKEMAIDGRTYLEMADARRISIAACRKRVQRAKETLRKKMRLDVTK